MTTPALPVRPASAARHRVEMRGLGSGHPAGTTEVSVPTRGRRTRAPVHPPPHRHLTVRPVGRFGPALHPDDQLRRPAAGPAGEPGGEPRPAHRGPGRGDGPRRTVVHALLDLVHRSQQVPGPAVRPGHRPQRRRHQHHARAGGGQQPAPGHARHLPGHRPRGDDGSALGDPAVLRLRLRRSPSRPSSSSPCLSSGRRCCSSSTARSASTTGSPIRRCPRSRPCCSPSSSGSRCPPSPEAPCADG